MDTQPTTYPTERLEEKKNKQSRAWVSSKHKKGEVGDTFLAFCELSRACILEKLPQSHQECWLIFSHWLTRPESTGSSSHLSQPSASLTSVNWYLLSTGHFCPLLLTVSFSVLLLLTLGPSFPHLLPVSWEISRTSSLCGFCAKTDKGILWMELTHTHRNECHPLCHKHSVPSSAFNLNIT